MSKLITLDRLKTFLKKLDSRFQKQLTFDSTPTSGSTNPVTSEGIYNALSKSVSVSIEPSDGTETWIEVPVENLIVGSTEPTDTNALWLELKE
jgi:hypothetical protein